MWKAIRILVVMGTLAGTFTSLGGAVENEVTYLFVQNAEGLKVKGDTITLKDVSSSTVYFSDRPERIAGHMTTRQFVDIWDDGDDSFQVSNPNAALSYYDGNDIKTAVVVLSEPVMKWGDLSYQVELLSGKLPSKGKDCSLFIDVIGRPRSPGSVAGAHRRARRRHVVVGSSIVHHENEEAYEDAREAEARTDAAEAEAREAEAKAATVTTSSSTTQHTPEEKMEQLNKMYKEGFISQTEYEAKKQEILSSF